MHVMLDGNEVNKALIDAARRKLGITSDAECAVDAALYTGNEQLDPAACRVLVQITVVERKRERKCA